MARPGRSDTSAPAALNLNTMNDPEVFQVQRPCIECGKPGSATRCGDCRRAANRIKNNTTQAKVYGSARWRNLRRHALRLQPWCSRCRTPGTPDNPLTVDHVVALAAGGEPYPRPGSAGLDILCRKCNSAKGSR